MRGILYPLEREAEDEGAIIRPLVGDACAIIPVAIDKDRIGLAHGQETIGGRYGILSFVDVCGDLEVGVCPEDAALCAFPYPPQCIFELASARSLSIDSMMSISIPSPKATLPHISQKAPQVPGAVGKEMDAS